jgi:hypothetical protein
MEAITQYLSDNSAALQGLAALVSIVLLIPSAIVFVLNQEAQRRQLKEERHQYILDRYRSFLELCASYPKLSLEAAPPKRSLSDEEHLQRDILFDILTSIMEQVFITYSDARHSHKKEQWRGWDDYIGAYAKRPDYLEWWRRIIFHGNPDDYFRSGKLQYDERFEAYIFGKIRQNFEHLDRAGILDEFMPSYASEPAGPSRLDRDRLSEPERAG